MTDVQVQSHSTKLVRSPRPARSSLKLLAGVSLGLGCSTAAVAGTFVGAVYSETNAFTGNALAAFGRNADGTLTPLADYATGGVGAITSTAGASADPLMSSDSVINVRNRFVLAVNAGSGTVSSFRVQADYSLALVSTVATGGFGPNSIAEHNGLVYVSNVDKDGVFTNTMDQSGTVTGFRLNNFTGALTAIAGSTRDLGTRPSNVRFSPDGQHLVISAHNAGSATLASHSLAGLQSFGVLANGTLTTGAQGTALSTLPGNAAGRNLPATIGFTIVKRGDQQIVIATESREYLPNGILGTIGQFQTSSISTWRLNADGSLSPLSQDVLTGTPLVTGPNLTAGPTSACWITVSPDRKTFWVADASNSAITSYRLNADGTASLIDSRAAAGVPAMPAAPNPLAGADVFTDIGSSSDGQFIYNLAAEKGIIDVYGVGSNGAFLSLLQQTTGLLPTIDSTGLTVVSAPAAVPEPGTWPTIAVLGLFGINLHFRRTRSVGLVGARRRDGR